MAPPHPKAQVISFVIQLLRLVPGLAADVDAQAAQKVFVHLAEDHREVGVAAPELGQLLLGQLRQGVGQGGDGAAPSAPHRCGAGGCLWPRYWVFSRHTGSSTWAEISSNWSSMPPTAFSAFSSRAEAAPSSVGGLAGDHPAVRQHHGAGRAAGGLRLQQGSGHRRADVRRDARPAASPAPASAPARPRPCPAAAPRRRCSSAAGSPCGWRRSTPRRPQMQLPAMFTPMSVGDL